MDLQGFVQQIHKGAVIISLTLIYTSRLISIIYDMVHK